MCGRMTSPEDWSEIRIRLRIAEERLDGFAPSYNVAPSIAVPVVTATARGRRLDTMRWGLVPAWATDVKIGYSTFNARAETVASRPAFRAAWVAHRRCLVLAGGFYEWRRTDRQPFFVSLSDRGAGPMTFAGLWEERIGRDGEILRSCTIITTHANALMETIHDRMPAILGAEQWAAWLDEVPIADAAALLGPYPPESMSAWPVDRRVGNVRNDDPQLPAPIELS
jgi:putative SOS response-associated peptidase YedK